MTRGPLTNGRKHEPGDAEKTKMVLRDLFVFLLFCFVLFASCFI